MMNIMPIYKIFIRSITLDIFELDIVANLLDFYCAENNIII